MQPPDVEVLNSRILIRPRHLDRSLAFYRDQLRLPIAREFGTGGQVTGVVFFAGNGFLEVSGPPRPEDADPAACALWLQVRDLPATVGELAAVGVPFARGPELKPWGLLEAWTEDPDGTPICLVEIPPEHPLRRRLDP
jgi:predicted enzyme related to lactoylglutathione lyase